MFNEVIINSVIIVTLWFLVGFIIGAVYSYSSISNYSLKEKISWSLFGSLVLLIILVFIFLGVILHLAILLTTGDKNG
jgi:membrane-bound ClpP family serine protease